jgi:DNA-binding HxlR family transcriptional regulator
MATMRTYGDRCGVARALDVVGERWALLIVRELVLGPKRFSDLRGGLPRVAPDVLSQRLRELEGAGVLRRTTLPPPSGARVYELTEWGQELEPLVIGLGAWGSRAPFPGGEAELGVDAFVIALKTLFQPGGFAGVVDLRLGDDRFALTVRGGKLDARRGGAEDPDLAILADPGPLAAAMWHGGPLDDVELLGDVALFDRFRALFPAPKPVSA